ncbi:MAG: 30S ribosomal protein S17 [Methylococcaceae bacterium]|nr:30S ribosomal protein S17 [Methylococcaceae bacterium]MCI0668133.1 30S ribosomal protein S17 [Methylococcaceae bacterium]MCI0733158.1 30S ribosomal protein S17 [Methylococcaceae bacterium]
MSDHSEKQKQVVKGRVVSNKMDKSITVLVERLVPHPVYGKYVRRSTRLMAHDEENVCQEGDLVALTACRPLSKRKTWRLLEVLETKQQ